MHITIPNNHKEERLYIINTLLTDFLGLNYSISISNTPSTTISFNQKKITITDSFFNNIKNNETYLNKNNIPKKIKKCKNPFMFTNDLVCLYGDNQIILNENEITCHIDIFASSFFMLTRWEEYVVKEKDQFNRFNDLKSCAYMLEFYDRPIVNEYTELIWNMLKHLNYKGKKKEHKFNLFHSHDIDHLLYWKNPFKFLKSIVKYSIFIPNLKFLFSSFIKYPLSLIDKSHDPYHCYDYLMDKSEKLNIQSHFYFMADKVHQYDNRYDITSKFATKTLKHIHDRGHIIGFHPSYNSYNNPLLFKEELNRLQSRAPQHITSGRQHYLKFEVPTTWQIWEDNNLIQDSTCGYPTLFGFRTGCCFPYHPFNILTKTTLKLMEYPLLIMEGVLYNQIAPDFDHNIEFKKIKLNNIIKQTKQYNGCLSLLCHNSSLFLPEWYEFKTIYDNLFSTINIKENK